MERGRRETEMQEKAEEREEKEETEEKEEGRVKAGTAENLFELLLQSVLFSFCLANTFFWESNFTWFDHILMFANVFWCEPIKTCCVFHVCGAGSPQATPSLHLGMQSDVIDQIWQILAQIVKTQDYRSSRVFL